MILGNKLTIAALAAVLGTLMAPAFAQSESSGMQSRREIAA